MRMRGRRGVRNLAERSEGKNKLPVFWGFWVWNAGCEDWRSNRAQTVVLVWRKRKLPAVCLLMVSLSAIIETQCSVSSRCGFNLSYVLVGDPPAGQDYQTRSHTLHLSELLFWTFYVSPSYLRLNTAVVSGILWQSSDVDFMLFSFSWWFVMQGGKTNLRSSLKCFPSSVYEHQLVSPDTFVKEKVTVITCELDWL